MKSNRPGILATRAVNQYRRRDIFTYLGLRYYLSSKAARDDTWLNFVAVDLARTRSELPYFHVNNFKEMMEGEGIKHRSLHMPAANEALAEAALLAECSKHPDVFGNPSCVFSYTLTSGQDRGGIFEPYMKGILRRQEAVSRHARNYPGGIVQYVDIKKFYPSISGDLAASAWKNCCMKAGLKEDFASLGTKLIKDHTAVQRSDESGILTGPMFSHLLANLVLREFDIELTNHLPVSYFRYVDDIILVGGITEVNQALSIVESKLKSLGFDLHQEGSEKRFRVPVAEWLEGEHDYREERNRPTWKSLVADIKKLLLKMGGDHHVLQSRLREAGFRIPVPDYSSLIYEYSWLERFRLLARNPWFIRKNQKITVESVVNQAEWLRNYHQIEFEKLIAEITTTTGFYRKRLIPRLRYTSGRLISLANTHILAELSVKALQCEELFLHGTIMAAVSTGNVDKLIPLGANAAQAAAQALAANCDVAYVTPRQFNIAETQAIAILIMNGVNVRAITSALDCSSEIMRLANLGSDPNLMRSHDAFLRELACLHGLSTEPRHQFMLQTAFDQDEDLVMDAIDQLQEYISL